MTQLVEMTFKTDRPLYFSGGSTQEWLICQCGREHLRSFEWAKGARAKTCKCGRPVFKAVKANG